VALGEKGLLRRDDVTERIGGGDQRRDLAALDIADEVGEYALR
jgi:hypothetical protein